MLEVVNGVRCVLWVLGVYALYAVPYAALYAVLYSEDVEGEMRLLEVLE